MRGAHAAHVAAVVEAMGPLNDDVHDRLSALLRVPHAHHMREGRIPTRPSAAPADDTEDRRAPRQPQDPSVRTRRPAA